MFMLFKCNSLTLWMINTSKLIFNLSSPKWTQYRIFLTLAWVCGSIFSNSSQPLQIKLWDMQLNSCTTVGMATKNKQIYKQKDLMISTKEPILECSILRFPRFEKCWCTKFIQVRHIACTKFTKGLILISKLWV